MATMQEAVQIEILEVGGSVGDKALEAQRHSTNQSLELGVRGLLSMSLGVVSHAG